MKNNHFRHFLKALVHIHVFTIIFSNPVTNRDYFYFGEYNTVVYYVENTKLFIFIVYVISTSERCLSLTSPTERGFAREIGILHLSNVRPINCLLCMTTMSAISRQHYCPLRRPKYIWLQKCYSIIHNISDPILSQLGQ